MTMNEKTAESSRAGRVLGRTEDRPVIRLLQAINLCFTRLYHRVTLLSPQPPSANRAGDPGVQSCVGA